MILRSRKFAARSERGYILITVILFVALLAIAAVVMAPVVAFQVKRDREEELIHRGVQYSRAMKHYVKKFGRYPTRIEELENTNQVRFLRRRYKDPLTGKDFKILRMGDVQLGFAGGVAGALRVNGANPAGGVPAGTTVQVSTPDANGQPNTMQLSGPAGGASPGALAPGAGAGPSAAPQENSNENGGDDDTDAAPNQSVNHPAAGPGAPGAFGTIAQGNPASGAQVFGGGPMVGVASTSKDKSIRIFNKKNHYYEWQFIYDPSTDRGGLLITPNQPSLQGTAQPGVPGTPGAPGAPGAPNPGAQNQPGQPPPPGMQTPQMPPDQEQ
jgi:type II secretory pathway pseudopilin PulG